MFPFGRHGEAHGGPCFGPGAHWAAGGGRRGMPPFGGPPPFGGGPFGGGGGMFGGGPFGGGPFGGGGGGGRARRGEARYVILDTLREGPKHGYEIIKALEDRSSGRYAPSPGTVYPVLQYLEELGLVHADQSADRRVYRLTDAGRAELEAHAEEISAFWDRFTGPPISAASQTEIGFLRDEFHELGRTLWSGLHAAIAQNDAERIRAARRLIERCKNDVRDLIAESQPGDIGEASEPDTV